MTIYSLAELYDKRNELAGLIAEAEKRARQFREDLAHVEAAIRILRPGVGLPAIVRKRVEFRPRYYKRGALSRLLLDWVRQRRVEPFTVEDVMPVVVADRQLSQAERAAVKATVHTAFRKMERRGIIGRVAGAGRVARWRSITEG